MKALLIGLYLFGVFATVSWLVGGHWWGAVLTGAWIWALALTVMHLKPRVARKRGSKP